MHCFCPKIDLRLCFTPFWLELQLGSLAMIVTQFGSESILPILAN